MPLPTKQYWKFNQNMDGNPYRPDQRSRLHLNGVKILSNRIKDSTQNVNICKIP